MSVPPRPDRHFRFVREEYPSLEPSNHRRDLAFATLDDVVRDAERLLAGRYDRAGKWNLGQTCWHLAEWMRFPLDGPPTQPLPIRGMLWVMRHTVGPRLLAKTLSTGKVSAGSPTMPQTVPGDDRADDAAGLEALRRSAERFAAHAGPLHPSPLFGPLDKPTSTKLQLVHCAHHLGFLTPKGD